MIYFFSTQTLANSSKQQFIFRNKASHDFGSADIDSEIRKLRVLFRKELCDSTFQLENPNISNTLNLNSLSEPGLKFLGSERHPLKMKVANVCKNAEGFTNRARIFSPANGLEKSTKSIQSRWNLSRSRKENVSMRSDVGL